MSRQGRAAGLAAAAPAAVGAIEACVLACGAWNSRGAKPPRLCTHPYACMCLFAHEVKSAVEPRLTVWGQPPVEQYIIMQYIAVAVLARHHVA